MKDKKIIVIDDMEGLRKLTIKMLKTIGFQNVIEAEDGVPALEKIIESNSTDSPVCLVISDWNMPEMDGLELLKKVRGIKSLKGLPFLIVTADALENDMVQAVKAGVSGILLKPFDMKQLKEKIENALE